ncbi:unnamed protein product [Clonostachys byssicola]|uniref:Uncharacterized protein n=1 Tax=Clonostachys byssicola TaxID=160290 RepID=A0A9N9UEM2_9HYPO|nr:unnamed protein product [Clonostachys byssicola]
MHIRADQQAPRMVDQRGRLLWPTNRTNRTKRPRLDADIHTPKKRKLNHPSVPPPQFWDNLSRPVFTRNALRELDRRNGIRDQSRTHTIHRWYNTRSAFSAAPGAPTQTPLQLSPTGRAQLKLSASHGGPDLRDLGGYRPPSKHARHVPEPVESRTGPYDCAFHQHLIHGNIFPPRYEYPNGDRVAKPENIEDIRKAFAQPRKSLSPSRFSEEEFEKFERADAHATTESRVVATVIPIIEGDNGDLRAVASDVAFTGLDHLTDGSLVSTKPDLYYGARPEQLQKEVREALSNLIIPSTQDDLPIAPNNFLEVKGPDGSLSVATRQATYDGALGSRALHALQFYGTEQIHDNKAYTLAWTYHGGHLKAYTSHPIPPSTPERPSGYAMTQLKGWSMTSDVETFRQGAAAYRNGKDRAKQQRDEAIAQANKTTSLTAVAQPLN